jgi:hypothetical protein
MARKLAQLSVLLAPVGVFVNVRLYRFPWRTQIKTTGLFFPFLARLFLMDVRYPFQRELDSVYK